MPGLLHQGAAAFPVAGIRDQEAQVGEGESVHGVEGDGAFRRAPKSPEVPPEEQGRGQGMVGEMIGRRRLDRTPRRRERASDGIRAAG